MLNVIQGGIKYHFLSIWYDLTWDWTQVSRAIGEHSNHYVNGVEKIKMEERFMFDGSFIVCFNFKVLSEYKNILSKLFLYGK